jgi:adenine deaminase
MGRLVVPYGTTTIIADPHEMVNVCGLKGLSFMLDAASETALDIRFMIPSCVPATPFEHAGAVIDAEAMRIPIADERILGVGEFMDFPGVINAEMGRWTSCSSPEKWASLSTVTPPGFQARRSMPMPQP